MPIIEVTEAERSTILAALRYWQNRGSKHQPIEDLEQIATNSGTHEELSADEIDDICERIGGA